MPMTVDKTNSKRIPTINNATPDERPSLAGGRSKQLPIPDVALDKIIDLMRVSEKEKSKAIVGLLVAAEQISYRERVGNIADNEACFKRIAALTRRLLPELKRVNESGRMFLDKKGQSLNSDVQFLFEQYISATRTLLEQTSHIEKQKRAAHRPRGSGKHGEVNNLIFALHRIAHEVEGRLTLGMHIKIHKPNGTLPAILKIFHQYFPDRVPENIPYRSLHRMRHAAANRLLQRSDDGQPPRLPIKA
jgi:hypothetical protein